MEARAIRPCEEAGRRGPVCTGRTANVEDRDGASGSKAGSVFMILAMLGLTALVASHFTDAAELWKTLKKANLSWIRLGVVLHVFYFVAYAVLYKIGFDAVGVKAETLKLLPLMMASIFVRAVVPSGGLSAAALFVDDAVQRRQSGARAAVGVVLVLLVDLITIVPFAVWGVVFLTGARAFKWYDALGFVLFSIYVAIMVILLAMAYRSAPLVRRLLSFIRQLVNRAGAKFHQPDLLATDWPQSTANQLSGAACALVTKPKMLALLIFWGMVLHTINLAGLWALVKAFGQAVPVGGLVAAFGMGIMFFVVGVIPEGTAIVETIMTLVFSSLGMSGKTAIAINLVFRGVNLWLPITIGIFALRRIRCFGQRRRGVAVGKGSA